MERWRVIGWVWVTVLTLIVVVLALKTLCQGMRWLGL